MNDQCALRICLRASANHEPDVTRLQRSTHCLSLACHASNFTSVP